MTPIAYTKQGGKIEGRRGVSVVNRLRHQLALAQSSRVIVRHSAARADRTGAEHHAESGDRMPRTSAAGARHVRSTAHTAQASRPHHTHEQREHCSSAVRWAPHTVSGNHLIQPDTLQDTCLQPPQNTTENPSPQALHQHRRASTRRAPECSSCQSGRAAHCRR